MKERLERLRFQGLFIKIFLVMVACIIAIAVSVVWTNLRMTQQLFLKTFSITNSKVLDQIHNNFESFHYSVVLAANQAQQSVTLKSYLTEKESDELYRVMNSYYNMTQQMNRIQSGITSYSVGLSVIGKNGRDYTGVVNYDKPTARELNSSAITANAAAQPGRMMYQYYQDEQGKHAIVATKVLRERTTEQQYGMLYIAIDESSFKPFYNNFSSEGNDFIVLDTNGTVVTSNLSDLEGQKNDELLHQAKLVQEQGQQAKKVHIMDRDKLMLVQYLPSYDFYLVNMIDQQKVLGQMVNTRSVVLICLFIVLIALVGVFLISRKMTRSITLLARQMSKVTRRNFHNYVKVSGGYEIRELGRAYNYMLDEINDYVDRLVETQKGQRKAELAALQQQINPHFLYNTLASVKFLVQQGSKDKAEQTIHALISLLQNTISNVYETVSVEQELVNLRSYVFINHIRYGERIRVHFFVAPDCVQYQVPKLIIQPFIENAFFHAFNRKTEGVIHVLIAREGQRLVCEVIDNGDGMELTSGEEGMPMNSAQNKVPKHSSKLFSGIGVANVNDRIRLLYGEEFQVNITSTVGEGTRVKITLPLIEKTENE
ncbi:sensor histidine kinase [Paenibacillus sp. NPDC058177]|uniref:cache domain-containing sensor histidine kinase n=1 Tax=Paenibacillus sp. NPDC058177 TaxID=3346369 RepID=UPI0036DEF37C